MLHDRKSFSNTNETPPGLSASTVLLSRLFHFDPIGFFLSQAVLHRELLVVTFDALGHELARCDLFKDKQND